MLLEASGLTRSFGGVTAIADLDFGVPEGLVYAVIGPNGAGKTTLFNLLSGIYRPDDADWPSRAMTSSARHPTRSPGWGCRAPSRTSRSSST